MKKYLIALIALVISLGSSAYATEPDLAGAIKKYKAQNYVGCIQDTEEITKKDPANAVAYYYMAIAYANIGNKEKAVSAYDKVIALSTNLTLVEYARKGSTCLTTPEECKPKNSFSDTELDRFIRSGSELSKEATDQLKKIQLEQMKNQINKDADLKGEMPTDAEIAQAVKTLARAGFNPLQGIQNPYAQAQQALYQNPEYMQLQMMLGNNQNNSTDFMSMLPYFLSQKNSTQSNPNMSADMLKNMMMSSMMGNINTTFDVNNDKY